MKYAPIALFVYKRPWHTKKTVESLLENIQAGKSILFIFSDGPKNAEDRKSVDDVRKYISGINGFKQVNIFNSKTHCGLAESIISGINRVFDDHDRIIVLEDDLVTSPYFLQYMNEGLKKFEKTENVMQISGYMFPIKNDGHNSVLLPFTTSWGWATWKRAWKHFNLDSNYLLREIKKNHSEKQFNLNNSYPYTNMLKDQINGKIDSWAIRWYASVFLKNGLVLYPEKSLVQNTGNDASGTHAGRSMIYQTSVSKKPVKIGNNLKFSDIIILDKIRKYLKSNL